MAALVIFDCDGVLVDSEPIAIGVLGEALAGLGLTLDETALYARFLGRSFSAMTGILADEFALQLPQSATAAMRAALYARFRSELRAMPGIARTIKALSVPVCVASSSQPARIALSLDVTGLAPLFGDNVFSASQVDRGKPAPDLFLHAAQSMGVAPQQCLVIEDSPAGVSAAKAAGMAVFGFTGGGHAEPAGLAKKLARLSPDALFSDMQALPDLLDLAEKRERFG